MVSRPKNLLCPNCVLEVVLQRWVFMVQPSPSTSTPLDRVRLAAFAAAQMYKNFTIADVTDDLVAPELHVYASPVALKAAAVANVLTIVVLPHGSNDRSRAVQPIRTMETSSEFKNLMGFTATGTGLTAVFPLSVLSQDNDVHVVFDQAAPVGYGKMGARPCTDCVAQFDLK